MTRLRPFILPALWALATGYTAFHSGMGPNHVDGGLLLGYLQTMAEGGRPYADFVDLYGLLSWPLPFAFFQAAGGKVWGLRLWLLFIKGASLGLTAWGVKRLAGTLYAAFALVLLALLLGLPWQLLQTTYAFVPALALELGVVVLLVGPWGPGLVSGSLVRPWGPGLVSGALVRPCGPTRGTPMTAVFAAGVLIGLTLLVKLNSGALLWAGALFASFYRQLEPGQNGGDGGGDQTDDGVGRTRIARSIWRALQVFGLLAYFGVFHLFIRAHYHGLYALYLSLPLCLLLGWTASHLPSVAAMGPNLRAWTVLLLVPPAVVAGGLALYLGDEVTAYLRDMGRMLAHLSYVAPVPPIGERGQYAGFNEYYWPQLTWLLSAVFVLWWWRAGRGARGPSPGSSPVPSLFAIYVCTLFVMYSRTDESHLHQSMLLAPAMLAVLLGDLQRRGDLPRAPAAAAIALLVYGCLSLGTLPIGEHLLRSRGDWSSPRLSGLHYATHPNPYVRPFAPGLDVRRWDQHIDAVASRVRERVPEGTEVLVLGKNELLNFASHTQPGGGRYRYLFYLIKNHHLDREGFFDVAPPGWLAQYLADPPPAIVTVAHDETLVTVLPEIARVLEARYIVDRSLGHMTLFRRRDLVADVP